MSNVIIKNNSNNTRIFSAQNRQKNKNIQPEPEKQHSYTKKKECTDTPVSKPFTTINFFGLA